MSTEDLEIHLPADTPGTVQGNGLSSILQTANGTYNRTRAASVVQISSPSIDEEDFDYSPDDVTNVSRVNDLEKALV